MRMDSSHDSIKWREKYELDWIIDLFWILKLLITMAKVVLNTQINLDKLKLKFQQKSTRYISMILYCPIIVWFVCYVTFKTIH